MLKPSGAVRLCEDFRKLNSFTDQDGYYMPTLDEIMEHVIACRSLTWLRDSILEENSLEKSSTQISVPADCVRAMAEFIQPITKTNLRLFLGAVGYYKILY